MQNVQNEPRIEPENAINNDLPAIYPTEQEIYEKKRISPAETKLCTLKLHLRTAHIIIRMAPFQTAMKELVQWNLSVFLFLQMLMVRLMLSKLPKNIHLVTV